MLRASHVPIPGRKPLHDHAGGALRDSVADRNKHKTVHAELLQRLLDAEGRERTS
jgi:hypothetical protein